ncbi:MAG: M4 family metallopeptidase [Geothrix sp.]|uniref:M4 family metallopeptidase n=1 Tax=Geothrix sp. TaxID=1962974 RepID=UPI003BAF6312
MVNPRSTTLLMSGLALVAGAPIAAGESRPLSATEWQTLRLQQPQRVQALKSQVRALRDRLGMGADFQAVIEQIDLNGATRVRFIQTFKDLPVWGSQVIARMDRQGQLAPVQAQTHAAIALEPRPTLSQEEAIQRALSNLKPGVAERLLPSKAELVVFPTKFQDGIKVRINRASGAIEIDPTYSVATRLAAEPYRLAFHVRTRIRRSNGESVGTDYMIDARTGSVLKKWDALQHAGEPAVGQGHSFHSGNVALNTTLREDGTFALLDKTRGTVLNPQGSYHPGLAEIGLSTGFYGMYQWEGFTNQVNEWGDGQWYLDGQDLATTINAQTAGVDAHHGAANAWDFYATVFGRNGFDNLGTSLAIATHVPEWWTGNPRSAAASFDGWYYQLNLGDGKVGASWTSQDIIGHELSHALLPSDFFLGYQGERLALDEANSDIMATMIEFWSKGDRSDTIPEQGGNWTVGEQVEDFPVRSMSKPSLDGNSLDAWCDGAEYLGKHSASGIANRFFYFLSQGTGSNADHQSAYLPNGMQGIGNHKAAHLWYTALTGYLSPTADFAGAREATLQAAEELHGLGSGEYRAVLNAWKAVNLDPASVRVILPRHPKRYDTISYYLPAGEAVTLKGDVRNARNLSLRWSLWGDQPWVAELGGKMSEGGQFQTPLRHGQGFGVKATSIEDPGQSALGIAWIVDLDVDQDAELDIFDLAALSLSYATSPSLPSADMDANGYTSDEDLRIYHNTLHSLLHK